MTIRLFIKHRETTSLSIAISMKQKNQLIIITNDLSNDSIKRYVIQDG